MQLIFWSLIVDVSRAVCSASRQLLHAVERRASFEPVSNKSMPKAIKAPNAPADLQFVHRMIERDFIMCAILMLQNAFHRL